MPGNRKIRLSNSRTIAPVNRCPSSTTSGTYENDNDGLDTHKIFGRSGEVTHVNDFEFDRTIERLRSYMSSSDEEDNELPDQLNFVNSSLKTTDPHVSGSPLLRMNESMCECQDSTMSRSKKLVVPTDFLNIPPPVHPPPMDRSIPDPPCRQPPMLPTSAHLLSRSCFDGELEYEEAKLRAAMDVKAQLANQKRRKRQKQFNQNKDSSNGPDCQRPQPGEDRRLMPERLAPDVLPECGVSELLTAVNHHPSGVACSSNFGSVPRHHQHHQTNQIYSPGSNQESQIYDTYETSILERNDVGSFYVPSSGRTSTVLSPAYRKSDSMDKQNKHTYSLLPSAKTTVPISVSPIKPNYSRSTVVSTTCKLKRFYCSWRMVSYALAAGLLFAFAVICYLMATLFATAGRDLKSLSNPNAENGANPGVDDLQRTFLRPMPELFPLGDQVVADLSPGAFGVGSFSVHRNSYVQFNWTVDAQSRLVVYGRQTVAPSPTENDFVEIIVGSKLHASPRKRLSGYYESVGSATYFQNQRSTAFTRYLQQGLWYISVYNDADGMTTVRFSAYLTDDQGLDCKYNCHEKGLCKNGKCSCYRGYAGPFCEETICPVLCSGNGVFTNGKCHCHKGWKGVDCQVPSNMCEVPHCNRRGFCGSDGECVCVKGYTGKSCEESDCEDSKCSGHGICFNSKCFCEYGYYGSICQFTYSQQIGQLCPAALNADLDNERCSGRGSYDSEEQKCSCTFGFKGDRCQNRICNLDCGQHGSCENDKCICDSGWNGNQCDRISCNAGCSEHGFCETNGICRCNKGWNGETCLLDGCGDNCSGNGECQLNNSIWKCYCRVGYSGAFCETPLELHCSDKIDNDGDSLVDCEDSECCSDPACSGSTFCETVPEPHQVLVRQQAPPPHASFYQKVRFLLDSESLQLYADSTLFDEKRVSVIRGRILNGLNNAPITGVRVTDSSNPLYGFTISRTDGWFDLLINGGGSITLQFMRLPFTTVSKTYAVAWNDILRIDDVLLTTSRPHEKSYPENKAESKFCENVDTSHLINPHVLSTWSTATAGFGPTNDLPSFDVFADSQSLLATLPIEGLQSDKVNLLYTSANQPGYKSTLHISALPGSFPDSLRSVRLRIDVEGVRFERVFEPKPNLTFTYGWNKRNAYKQKVYGLTKAIVSLAYTYKNCTDRPIRVRRQCELDGFRPAGDHLGGWNFNIRHKLDVNNGVLEKGDGSVLYMQKQSLMLKSMLDGAQSPTEKAFLADQADDPSSQHEFNHPVALAMAKDGVLYIGTNSAIFHRMGNGQLRRLFDLRPSDAAHKFYMVTHPMTATLHVSFPMRRQILKLVHNATIPGTFYQNPQSSSVYASLKVVAGTGKQCAFNENQCGDGGSALSASLNFPKGLAFDSRGNLYFADERKIRKVSVDGLITTLIGSSSTSQSSNHDFRPVPCQRRLAVNLLNLQWPTSLAADLFNNRLFFVDGDSVVFEIDVERRPITFVRLAAGIPPHCASISDDERDLRSAPLDHVTSLAVAMDGRLLIGESGNAYARLRFIDPDSGRYSHVSGSDESASVDVRNDQSATTATAQLAKSAFLKGPIEIAADYASSFVVLDAGTGKILSMEPQKPHYDSNCRCYSIIDPNFNELYVFNWKGQHLGTKNLITDKFAYNFSYSHGSSYGLLSHVTFEDRRFLKIDPSDAAQNKIFLIANNLHKTTLIIDRFNNMLGEYRLASGGTVELKYDSGDSGLLTAKNDGRGRQSFGYDKNGRISSSVHPTGQNYQFSSHVGDKRLNVFIRRNGLAYETASTDERHHEIYTPHGNVSMFESEDVTLIRRNFDKSFLRVLYDQEGHSLIDEHQSSIFRRKITVGSDINDNALSNNFEWRFRSSNRRMSVQVGRRMRINGVNILNFNHDRQLNMDSFADADNNLLLTITYDNYGNPAFWNPIKTQSLAPMNVTYDLFGKVSSVSWGSLSESYTYDILGRLVDAKPHYLGSHKAISIEYSGDSLLPKSVTTPSGKRYSYVMDQKSGLLEYITSPLRVTHKFYEFSAIAETVYAYASNASGKSAVYYVAKNADQRLKFITYPSGSRKTEFQYDNLGLKVIRMHNYSLLDIKFTRNMDGTRKSIIFNYGPSFSMNKTVVKRAFLATQLEDKRRILIERKSDRFNTLDTTFLYEYDNQFRLKTLRTYVDGLTLQPIEFDYSPFTGRISRFWTYKVEYSDGKTRFSNEHCTFETSYSMVGEPALSKVFIKNRPILERRLLYDAQNRLVESTLKLFPKDQTHSKSFEYDDDGQLSNAIYKLNLEETGSFRYRYDSDGDLIELSVGPSADYSFANLSISTYRYDIDRFLIGRGLDDRFEYDSLGRLSRAWSGSSIDNRYFYDEMDRIVAWNRSSTGLYHFWYGLINRPALITHVLYPDDALVTFYYEPISGALVGMEKSGTYYVVSTDRDRTPEVLIAMDGSVLAHFQYSPTGALRPTNLEFLLPVSFKGNFQDPDFNVVITPGGRPYDAIAGRYMSVDARRIFDRVDALNPAQSTNLLSFNNNDPVNRILRKNLPLSVTHWLHLIGLEANGAFAEDLNAQKLGCGRSPVKFASYCALAKKAAGFETVSSRPSAESDPYHSNFGRILRFNRIDLHQAAFRLNGSIINIVDDVLSGTDGAPNSDPQMSILLNDSHWTKSSVHDTRWTAFLWKSLESFADDFGKLGFGSTDPSSLLANRLPALSANHIARNWTISNLLNGRGKNIRIWNEIAAINLCYSASFDDAL